MNTMTDGPALLTMTQVGERLGRNRATIRQWIKRGYLRGKQVNGRTYVTAAELERFLREGNR